MCHTGYNFLYFVQPVLAFWESQMLKHVHLLSTLYSIQSLDFTQKQKIVF